MRFELTVQAAQVLKLDVVSAKETNVKGIAAQTTLSMNQTLEGHKGAVLNAAWNPQHRKLTTSDSSGLIIVWGIHNGQWYQEMVNNRGRSVVTDLRWRSSGSEICIAYEDGVVILGTVDGNRLWSKDLGAAVRLLDWAPDAHAMIFAMEDGSVNVVTHLGVRVGSVPLPAASPGARLIACEWYDGVEGLSHPAQATLLLAWSDGRVQLMLDEEDDQPVIVSSGLSASVAKWNSNGTVWAIAGTTKGGTAEVQCYSPLGRLVTSMRVPGTASVSSLSWEGGGLRLALAVDAFVCFANVRPDYRWAWFGTPAQAGGPMTGTLAYAYARPDKSEAVAVFVNAATETRHVKYVRGLVGLVGHGEHCMMISRTLVEAAQTGKEDEALGGQEGRPRKGKSQTTLILSNSIGTPLESRTIEVEPVSVCMGPSHVAVASSTTLYTWQYRVQGQKLGAGEAAVTGKRRDDGREKTFHLNAEEGGADDSITCLTMTDSLLLVGRASGVVVRYRLPDVKYEATYQLRQGCRPAHLAVNSNQSRFSIIDSSNVLSFYAMTSTTSSTSSSSTGAVGTDVLPDIRPGSGAKVAQGLHLTAGERKDVWQICWASDAPELCAIMEKARLYVLRDGEPEEPVLSSGYLCAFSDLSITSALLDDVFAAPDRPTPVSDILMAHDVRSLRDTRALLSASAGANSSGTGGGQGSASLKDAVSFVRDKAHPRLWRLLAETALEQLELPVAEAAYVALSDYGGLQFVKKLRLLREASKQKAEVAAYLRRFDEAEKLFLDADRRDLALDMRQRIDDWPRVLTLLERAGGDDAPVRNACEKLGKWCADRQQWHLSVSYYERSGSLASLEALVNLYYTLESYKQLSALVDRLPPAPQGTPALTSLAFKLQSVGLTDSAADAYLKAEDVKSALDCCVQLNQWERALALGVEHNLPQVQTMLSNHVQALLDAGNLMQAVQLYRKAGRYGDAAKILAKLGADSVQSRSTLLQAKKLFVLSALQVQRYKAAVAAEAKVAMTTSTGTTIAKDTMGTLGATVAGTRATGVTAAAATLATLTRMDAESMAGGASHPAAARTLDAAWHAAEGVHLFMLAQRQLFAGDPVSALITLGFVMERYEDVVPPADAAGLAALAGYYAQAYASTSKALSRLQDKEGLSATDKEGVAELAIDIFTRTRPSNPPSLTQPAFDCPRCKAGCNLLATSCIQCKHAFQPCIATGRPLGSGTDTVTCHTCGHRAYVAAVRGRKCCPLCHGKPG